MASPGSSPRSYLGTPVPVSIALYNRLPLLPVSSDEAASKKWLSRPDHTLDLLASVKLEIVQRQLDGKEKATFSSVQKHSSVRTVWEHLNERVSDWEDNWGEQSSATFARIVLQQSDNCINVIVDEVPLNPKSLRRLPSEATSSSRMTSPAAPSALPPNSVLIHYSDGLTRVQGSLYYSLLNQGIIRETDPRDASLIHDDDEEDRRKSRFNDEIFDVLDQVPSSSSKQSSLLETDDESLATPLRVAQEGDFHPNEFPTHLSKVSCTELDADAEDLTAERDKLLVMIAAEEAKLEADSLELEDQRSIMLSAMNAVKNIRDETHLIRKETRSILSEKVPVEEAIALCQMKLLNELQGIYPITYKLGDRYLIAGAELPIDLFGGDVNEEEISAALGFLAHSLVMMSKYLSIPLRYRIICNSSRSAIQEEGAKILPLFLARTAERQHLERGIVLLNHNIDCIAKTRGIKFSQADAHILVKVHEVYEFCIRGSAEMEGSFGY